MEQYEELKMEIIAFENEDVITASPTQEGWGGNESIIPNTTGSGVG